MRAPRFTHPTEAESRRMVSLDDTVSPAFFRSIDWLALAVVFVAVWVIYVLTLAPEVTLEDSGELVTASFYAGIAHPPGYPLWSIYSWLWTVLVPIGNVARRVAFAEATSGAAACGLVAMIVARGSSLLIRGIEDPRMKVTEQWENRICVIAGCIAGVLLGVDDVMWRESVAVNRIAVSGVPLLLLVLVYLMRWIYVPEHSRNLSLAALIFGICFTAHQSLLVAALAFEVALATANSPLTRDVLFGNFTLYFIYNIILLVTGKHLLPNIGARPGLLLLFNLTGIGSFVVSGWLMIQTKGLLTELRQVLKLAALWALGASLYVYLPIVCMTNPPMQWGYPRTFEGFLHVITRAQYEQPNPTNLLADCTYPLRQLVILAKGVASSFTWVYALFALLPLCFLYKMSKAERRWITVLGAMYLCLGVLMILLLNPTQERESADIVKVFFAPSHAIIACLIGYGITLTLAFVKTYYMEVRLWGILCGSAGFLLAVYGLWDDRSNRVFYANAKTHFAEVFEWIVLALSERHYGVTTYAGFLIIALPLLFVATLILCRRPPMVTILAIFSAMPLYPILSHWLDCEQHNHWFGYHYGHDMFRPPFKRLSGKPLYGEMPKNAILFGGTDPGRFCPTYMIFCESVISDKQKPTFDQGFDRRDVYILTQNGLADPDYLNSVRAQYNRSAQIDRPLLLDLVRTVFRNRGTNYISRIVKPLDTLLSTAGSKVERHRRICTSWFRKEDFLDISDLAARLRPGPKQDSVSKWVYEGLGEKSRVMLLERGNSPALRKSLARDFNRILERETLSGKFARAVEQVGSASAADPVIAEFLHLQAHHCTGVRLNRLLLEAVYARGIRRSVGGIYPDREIYIPSPEDLRECRSKYVTEVQRRTDFNQVGSNDEETRSYPQLSSGIFIDNLMTKCIFDHNPENELFIEESFPLDWMYPHLTPYGLIMKINREALPSLGEETLRTDHEFWTQYAKRLTGCIVEDGTSVKHVTDWIMQIYMRQDLSRFTGDRKFLQDRDAQRAFCKLRTSIGGVYSWRLNSACPPAYRPKSDTEYERLLREADFAFLQALAFCPYSTEIVWRYTNLLTQPKVGRIDDAALVIRTSLLLDPENRQLAALLRNLPQ